MKMTLASLREFVEMNAETLMLEAPKAYTEQGRGVFLIFMSGVSFSSGQVSGGQNLDGQTEMRYLTLEMLEEMQTKDTELAENEMQKRIMKMVKSYNPKTQFVIAAEDENGGWLMTKIRIVQRPDFNQ